MCVCVFRRCWRQWQLFCLIAENVVSDNAKNFCDVKNSDVNKDLSFKAKAKHLTCKAKAKYLTFKAKPRTYVARQQY